jgi:hypothetical protein
MNEHLRLTTSATRTGRDICLCHFISHLIEFQEKEGMNSVINYFAISSGVEFLMVFPVYNYKYLGHRVGKLI